MFCERTDTVTQVAEGKMTLTDPKTVLRASKQQMSRVLTLLHSQTSVLQMNPEICNYPLPELPITSACQWAYPPV